MAEDKVNVAIIGLGFGTQFVPIYKRHRQANMYEIWRRSEKELNAIGDIFEVEQRHALRQSVPGFDPFGSRKPVLFWVGHHPR
jgi:hypothetical protein